MAWTIEFKRSALKQLEVIDPVTRERVLAFLRDRLAPLINPRRLGERLQGKAYRGIWKYRVGDYRILAEVKDDVLTILVVEIGHRRGMFS
jgi:mRNA interferase RelE/StbE